MNPRPDLSKRPHQLQVERRMNASPATLYRAWTEGFGIWFARPGSVAMTAKVGAPFFFETEYGAERHPHYGRLHRLEPDQLVELTWVTGAAGTEGAETVVTVEISPSGAGAFIKLTHAGFASEGACKQHADAWPMVLEQLDAKVGSDQ
jgi:uncharacterized protein YndB with AHSA1/START domain